ncbi:DUF262 domain-containing protein [Brachybacterium sp. UNK5269]|uniref:DUF262 domain-containing protein n=1 Tax=Brachybacterium sp. UNK5269 TaxID=3408576 RepID=UPI003BB0C527
MDTPLDAASTTAGALFSGSTFSVPQFQREYAWDKEEVEEFFFDLARALNDESYFLGLIIVTGEGATKDIVDGQQRILTITLLASILYNEALKYERKALADRLRASFLVSIDFQTDKEQPRVTLSSKEDNESLQRIIAGESISHSEAKDSTSSLLAAAYTTLEKRLREDLQGDPFKRLGIWADFMTNHLYLARFVHPDPGSAYRVFEVINTRGKELTTADLLKSYVLSQTPAVSRENRYSQWSAIARVFGADNQTSLVQFIRHAVTTTHGHVLPRDLYDVLTARNGSASIPVSPGNLIELLGQSLPIYRQMMDPTADGPASDVQLGVFSILNRLGIVSVRPILLAMSETSNSDAGFKDLLRLVVRRVVVGSLGTGNIERRFGVTARRIAVEGRWEDALKDLSDLNPDRNEFAERVHHRSMNKNTLSVIRESVLENTVTPEGRGNLFFIKPRTADWSNVAEESVTYWVSTIGNTFLADESRRPMGSSTWRGFINSLAPSGISSEWTTDILSHSDWTAESIDELGAKMSARAAEVWYD